MTMTSDSVASPQVVITGSGPDSTDLFDAMHAVPYALRRAGLSTARLPGIAGNVRLLAPGEGAPFERLADWLVSVGEEAELGLASLRMLERHVAHTELALATLRKPAAARRIVGASLWSWVLYATKFARAFNIEVSTASRSLAVAEDLGLVHVVPNQAKSRGNGTLYAAPPWLIHAGLLAASRGRAAKTVTLAGPDTTAPIAEADAAIAAIDELLRRQGTPLTDDGDDGGD